MGFEMGRSIVMVRIQQSGEPAPVCRIHLATGEDLNGDGLPDAWRHFTTPSNSIPSGDADGDGQSNAQEALWGTNPFDPASKVSLTFLRRTPMYC